MSLSERISTNVHRLAVFLAAAAGLASVLPQIRAEGASPPQVLTAAELPPGILQREADAEVRLRPIRDRVELGTCSRLGELCRVRSAPEPGGEGGALDPLGAGRIRHDGGVGRETLLRLTALYYTALADGRQADAAALEEALTALGAPPAPVPSPQPLVPVVFPPEVPPAAATLADLRGCLNLAVRVKVIGALDGSVWGTDVYTDDSALGAAAVHAGLVQPGETADVVVFLGGPRDAYEGSERHGVISSAYGPWGGSFRLAPLSELPDAPHFVSAPPTMYRGDDPATVVVRLSDIADSQVLQPGTGLVTVLTGHTQGGVWGTDLYTSDSSLPAAAVHAGVLKPGERGVVRLQIEPGQESYTASTRNGVVASSWGSYSSSFRFVPVECTPPGPDGE